MMESNALIYTHGNGLSTSMFHTPHQNNQVSSVGFTTLKKWDTQNSQILTNSTISAATSKGISRLFTRSSNKINDSNQTLKRYNSNTNEESTDSRPRASTETKRPSNIFKFSKNKSNSNRSENPDNSRSGGLEADSGGKQTKNRPELTVQTTGHQSYKVAKKILTSGLIEDSKNSNRKNTVSSPVSTFHSLFHRSHSNSQSQASSGHDGTNGNGLGPGVGPGGMVVTPSKMQKMEESLYPHVHHHHARYPGTNNHNRTAIGLSSNNSNSTISDIAFAMVYNFTDPDYSVDLFDEKNSGQSSSVDDHNLSIKDIQRKLMVPADQYFQSKLSKGNEFYSITNSSGVLHNTGNANNVSGGSFGSGSGSTIRDSHSNSMSTSKTSNSFGHSYGSPSISLGGEFSLGGLGIITVDSEYYYNRYLLDFSKNNGQFFNSFLGIIKPVFLKSKEQKLSNGSTHAYVGMTLEDVSNFVQENYVKQVTCGTYSTTAVDTYSGGGGVSPIGATKRRIRGGRSASNSGENNGSSATTTSGLDVSKIDDVIIREIYQDILTFCVQCMIMFVEDFKLTLTAESTPLSSSTSEVRIPIIKEWERIVLMWQYFNEKIRYQIVTALYPLEKFFQSFILSTSTLNPINIEIEGLILLAFRDSILIPFFLQRANEYRQVQAYQESESHANTITYEEEKFLKENNCLLLGKVIDCMGVILTQTTNETGNADGEEHIRLDIFREMFEWVTGII